MPILLFFLQFFLSYLFSVEIRIISSPKARPILVNGAVRKGDRLVPPSALDILMRLTFSAPSARVKVGSFFVISFESIPGFPKVLRLIHFQSINNLGNREV